MAVLRALKGLSPGQMFPLQHATATLGRHPDCDIVLDVKAVSREHARISRIEGAYYIEDLRSRNGTYLNEHPVDGRRPLTDGDQVRICDLVFVFHEGPPEAAVTAWEQDQGVEATALMVDDERPATGSTVMSKVDVSTGTSGIRLAVNAEAKLKALIEIGKHVGQALGVNEVFPKLLDSLFNIFIQADRGFIVLRERPTGRLILKAVRHRREHTEGPMRISRTVVNSVMQSKEAILSADAATDSRFDMAESIVDFQIHSIMCAPLIDSGGNALGVIQIDTLDPRNRFTREDLEVLASVACQAAVIVENAQLHEIAVQERVHSRELALAHEVQLGFMPAARPVVPGYEFFDHYDPAQQLGGDYFDYIPLSGGRLAVVLADVSGKGISAALLVARLSAETRYCLVSEPTPSSALSRLNRVFCENRWEGRFVTCALAVLDAVRHEVTVLSAGHMAPLLRRPDSAVIPVGEEATGLPLGVECGTTYGQHRTAIAPGESLVMYTDGMTDAMNAAGQFYGTERLTAQIAAAGANIVSMGRRVLDDVQRFVGNQPQTDDMCLACFGRLAE